MKNNYELTEKLKVIETDIYEARIYLKSINSKLEISYQYETELLERLSSARIKTKELQNEFYKKSGEISQKYDKMKLIFEVFTGNIYNHI